ncbi:MAG: radical SAM protein [Candidatus Hydrogenedentota bacterium]
MQNPYVPDPRFITHEDTPACLHLPREELGARVDAALQRLAHCRACPRLCGVDRLRGAHGRCNTGRYARVASSFPHMGEEDCLRGTRGSGTIFFSGCNLCCAFCQNWDISQRPAGREMTGQDIARQMLSLQELGCHNINFVTPSHVAPQVLEAIACAIDQGLRLPIVYNTSAYDSVETLRLFEGVVDIYMPDVKFWEPATAAALSAARDYPERMREAVAEMQRQVGVLMLGPDGVARRGLLVRHLVMPGLVAESRAIFQWLAEEISPETCVNIMGQYRPANRVGLEPHLEYLNRRVTPRELDQAVKAAREAGIHRLEEYELC